MRVGTWLLWFGPFALVLLAGLILLALRRRNSMEFEPLSPDEERALTDILGDGDIRRDADAN